MKKLIIVLATPTCWLRGYNTNKRWDKELNRLLDVHEVEVIDTYTARLGDVSVWIGNKYSAFGYPCRSPVRLLPSRATAIRLHAAVLDSSAKMICQA